jgi:hypothetical protein
LYKGLVGSVEFAELTSPFCFSGANFSAVEPQKGESKTMKTLLNAGGLLLALMLCSAAAWGATGHAAALHSTPWLIVFLSGLGLVGAAGTVTYLDPKVVNGTSTAPTTSQVSNAVIANVTMADAATATTVTHNLSGVSTNGADGSPMIHIMCLTAGATPVGMGVTFSFTTNGVILNNITTAAGNGCTYRVQIWRHSLITNFTN